MCAFFAFLARVALSFCAFVNVCVYVCVFWMYSELDDRLTFVSGHNCPSHSIRPSFFLSLCLFCLFYALFCTRWSTKDVFMITVHAKVHILKPNILVAFVKTCLFLQVVKPIHSSRIRLHAPFVLTDELRSSNCDNSH